MSLTGVRKGVSAVFWRFSGWKLKRELELVVGPRILIGAPHTSNFDFLLMLAITWDARMSVHWLGKKELFRGIAGPIMRGLGGIAVDRNNAAGVVKTVIRQANADENFILVVTPEGTRSGTGWRSGFYRIAWEANLPVTLGFVDLPSKTSGLGPTLHLTGDVVADMDRVREFYHDISGVRPKLRTEPRLQDEAGLTKLLKERSVP
jgi:1-acyl-sn-glycerol-3-phosphate acyltransferase